MGEDIVVAILDSGIAGHPDFENRIVLFKDFTKERSFDEITENKVMMMKVMELMWQE